MPEQLWKCTATCKVCGAILNTARNVPEDKKAAVGMSAPLVAICEVKAHNSLSDCNFGAVLKWELEE